MASSSAYEFKRFDVVSNGVIDNHFYEGPTRPSPDLHKKIMHEWRILEKHLPETIFVRVHERQIDLLRAAIIGAAGTPYHDALFFFDLSFPADYPNRPPVLHYRSHGHRINPNLYACGKVCLSLLNTWTGKKSEMWNPKESTILQVLVSIQALVLNSKPYFNEPGAGIIGNWEKQSRAYNENAFLLTCKTTANTLRNPPRDFEQLVVEHFRRERAATLLGACRAYAEERVRVGEYREGCCNWDETASLEKKKKKKKDGDVARKFREELKMVYKLMWKAFVERGIPVEGFGEVLVLEDETTTSGREKSNNKNDNVNGIVKRFVEKMKKVLRLKKAKEKEIPVITWFD